MGDVNWQRWEINKDAIQVLFRGYFNLNIVLVNIDGGLIFTHLGLISLLYEREGGREGD